MKKCFWCKIRYDIINVCHFRFRSSARLNRAGFHIEYKALQGFTACGGSYSNASGVISSPLHPNLYPDQAGCVYLISQPKGSYINISFLSLDIDCQGTPSDFIELRDGYFENSPLMITFCGNRSNVPDIIQTTQNHLRIRWFWMRSEIGLNL